MTSPTPIPCPHCEPAGSGRHGVHRCYLCDGTGKILNIGGTIFPNTPVGFEEARAAVRETP